MLDQRNASEFALKVNRLCTLFRLLKKCPHPYGSAKGCAMTFPPTNLWDYFGSPDILEYVEMKLPMSSEGKDLFTSLSDWNYPWESPGRI
jgi:hypothetical protein